MIIAVGVVLACGCGSADRGRRLSLECRSGATGWPLAPLALVPSAPKASMTTGPIRTERGRSDLIVMPP